MRAMAGPLVAALILAPLTCLGATAQTAAGPGHAIGETSEFLPAPVAGGFDLPNGWRITPAGEKVAETDDLILNIIPSPDGKVLIAMNSGYQPHALTVIDAYQHYGAGTLLHAFLHLTASRYGIHTFRYDVLWENSGFLRYLKSLGGKIIRLDSGVAGIEMPVYASAMQVPHNDGTAMRFARLMHDVMTATPVVA